MIKFIKKMRIDDLEIRKINDSDHYIYEIVKWSPNKYYEDFKNGLLKKVEGPLGGTKYQYEGRDGYYIDESCIKHPESCYVIAFVNNDKEPDIVSVGSRPWDLKPEEKKIFDEIVRYFFKSYYEVNEDTTEEEKSF